MKPLSISIALSVAAAVAVIGSLGPENLSPQKPPRMPEHEDSEDISPSFESSQTPSPPSPFQMAPHYKLKRGFNDDEANVSTPGKSPTQVFEDSVDDLFQRMKHFKMEATESPDKLTTEYPQLSEQFYKLFSDFAWFKESSYTPSEHFCLKFEELGSIFEMIELNTEMRQQGCQKQLSLEYGSLYRQTWLMHAMEKFDTFVEYKEKCYAENIDPILHKEAFAQTVDSVVSRFDTLKADLSDFMAANSPLSRLFQENVKELQDEITILVNLKEGPSNNEPTQKNFFGLCWKNANGKHDRVLGQMEHKLAAALTINYQKEFPGDIQKLENWRDALSAASKEVSLQLLMSDFPQSRSRTKVESLLEKCRAKLTSNINSVLLLAIALSSEGGEPGTESLSLFKHLTDVLHHDYENIESKLLQSVKELTKLSAYFDPITEFERKKFQSPIRIQKALLEGVSQYMDQVEWANLFHAEDLKMIEREAYSILGDLETKLNGWINSSSYDSMETVVI
ncbi:hypothetical protein JCM33374_g2025 [Metschnikowia sp. JCM 33374]|nr:hypothetical protein JCM33374_g2025 [Metschnikowia sp. JCM 33374]